MPTIKGIAKNLFDKFLQRIDEKIVFFHVPKCGGTSIDSAIKRYYPLFRRCYLDPSASEKSAMKLNNLRSSFDKDYYYVCKYRELLLLYFLNSRNKFISGHFSFNSRLHADYKDENKFISVIRHPVKRWISQFFYNKYKTTSDHYKIDSDLEEFITTKRAQNWGHTYIKLFGDLSEDVKYYSTEEAIKKAKDNLADFDLVGTLEKIEIFKRQFKEGFNKSLKIPSKNTSPKSQSFRKSTITEKIEEKIRGINAPDMEIYNYVTDNFVNKVNS